MILLDGKALAAKLQSELAEEVSRYLAKGQRPPCLATVLVGEDPASGVYVKNKRRTCERLGMRSIHHALSAATTQAELLTLVDTLNADDSIDGILVQLPLPKHLESREILERIRWSKDVDGFHPMNVGRLALGEPCLVPCTPQGVMALLAAHDVKVSGAHAVVMGRSAIVGKPMVQLLTHGDATVTCVHSKTPNAKMFTRQADILVVAIGRPEYVDPDWLKPGVVVVDVGIHKTASGKLVGDVAYERTAPMCHAISPVPGGVGPLTITMLMSNTLQAYKARLASG